jgi:hypothetical protein
LKLLGFSNQNHGFWVIGAYSDASRHPIPIQSATPFRLIPPPCSDPKRHPIPKHSATPEKGLYLATLDN